MSRIHPPKSLPGRLALAVLFLGAVFALFWWRGPSFRAIGDAFTAVVWEWVVVAIAINLASVVVRALAWTTVINSAMPPPHPKPTTVFSAFSVGLFANAVLPGRIGELARVAVLTRKVPRRKGLWATLVGTVLAHRVFDIVPVMLLILYVLVTAKVPAWAIKDSPPPEARFWGYSVGRWVDDYTFVADSNGYDDRSWLDNAGRPHSDALHVIETYHRVDADHLEKTITIDDPKYYTRPWVALEKLPYRLQSASLEIPEQECVPSETAKYNQLFANPAAGVSGR